jgi:hypothetical protein
LNTNCPNWTSKSYNPELPYPQRWVPDKQEARNNLKKRKKKIILIKAQNTHARAKERVRKNCCFVNLFGHPQEAEETHTPRKQKKKAREEKRKEKRTQTLEGFFPSLHEYLPKKACKIASLTLAVSLSIYNSSSQLYFPYHTNSINTSKISP